ncbi:hypothetical protein GCM10027188_29750 [Lysobacter humi (ex Lee et al. 2017)]
MRTHPLLILLFSFGVLLLCVGIAVAFLNIDNYDALPNHEKLLVFLPWLAAVPLIFAPAFAKWHELNSEMKARLVMMVVTPAVVAVGAGLWYLQAAGTYG